MTSVGTHILHEAVYELRIDLILEFIEVEHFEYWCKESLDQINELRVYLVQAKNLGCLNNILGCTGVRKQHPLRIPRQQGAVFQSRMLDRHPNPGCRRRP